MITRLVLGGRMMSTADPCRPTPTNADQCGPVQTNAALVSLVVAVPSECDGVGRHSIVARPLTDISRKVDRCKAT